MPHRGTLLHARHASRTNLSSYNQRLHAHMADLLCKQ